MKTILILIALIAISSCSTRISMRTQSAQFISPESVGKRLLGEGTFFYAAGTVAEVDLRNGESDNSLKLVENQHDSLLFDSVGGNFDVGIISRLDFVAHISGEKHPIMYGLKYQIIGDPRMTAKQGNHSLALVALGGSGSQTQENDDAIELVATDEEATVELRGTATKAALIYGYRLENDVLAYLGSSYSTTNFEGDIESDNAAVDGKKIDYAGNHVGAQVGLMIDLGRLVNLKFEASHQKVNWEKTDPRSFNYLSAGLGFNWY